MAVIDARQAALSVEIAAEAALATAATAAASTRPRRSSSRFGALLSKKGDHGLITLGFCAVES
jgi:hypothetical protein